MASSWLAGLLLKPVGQGGQLVFSVITDRW